MALNNEDKDISYLLGRLFALLEKAQREALGDVNASMPRMKTGIQNSWLS